MASAALELLIQLEDRASSGLSALGGSLGNIGMLAGGAVVAGLAAAGAAAFSFASDAAQGVNDLQASLGVTRAEAESLGQVAVDVFANNWGDSLADVNAGIITVRQQMQGIGEGDLAGATQAAFALRDVFGTELPASTNAANTLMQNFGLTSSEAFDFIASGMQNGLDASGDFLDTIGEYSTQFSNGGADAGQFFSLMQSGLQGGVLGTDKAADAFKEFSLRIADGSTLSAGALSGLGINAKSLWADMSSGKVTTADAFQSVVTGLNAITDPVERNRIGVALLGTQYEDLGASGVLGLDMTTTKLTDLAGATDSLNAKYNNWPAMWEGVKRTALVAIQPIGDALLGVANEVMPVVQAVIGALSGVFAAFQEAGPLSSEVGEAIGFLATQLGLPGEAVQDLVFWIQGNLVPAFQSFLASLQPVADFLMANLTPILVGLGTVLAVALIPPLIATGVAVLGAVASFALLAAPILAIVAVVALLYNAWVTNFGGIQQIIQPVIDAVVNGFGEGGILGAISGLVSGLSAAWPQIVGWFQTAAVSIGQQLLAWGQALVNWIAPAIPPALAALSGLASSFFSWIASQAGALAASFSSWATGIAAWIPGAIVSFLAAWPSMLSGFLDWIAGAVGPIIAGFGSWLAAFLGETAKWAVAFVSWVVPMIPGLLAALAGAAAALIVFLGQTLGVIVGKLLEWGIAFVKWVAPMIPPMLAALGGAIVALLGWAAQQVPVIAAKIKEWGTAFLGWVGSEVVPRLPGILATILTTIGGWISGAASWLIAQAAGLGRSIVEGVSKGISAAAGSVINSMKNMATDALNAAKSALGIGSPSTVMAELVGIPLIQGIQKGMEFATPKLLQSVLDVGSKIVDLIDKGVGAFQKLRNMGALPLASITNFTDALFAAMNAFGQAAVVFTSGMVSSASLFTFKSNQFLETMSAAIDVIVKLQDFKGVAPQAIRDFADSFDLAIKELVRIAQFQTMLGMLHAKQFADNAGEIVKVIGAGVDALSKLRNFARPSVDAIWAFSMALSDIVFAFFRMNVNFSAEMLSAASVFTDGAGKVAAQIGDGVEGLAALKDFAAPGINAIWEFALALSDITYAFVVMGRLFNEEMLAAAESFAGSVASVVSQVGEGVSGLSALADFAGPGINAIWEFAQAIADLTYAFVIMGQKFSADMTDAAVAFTETAASVMGIIGASVEGFAALSGFVAPAREAVQSFIEILNATVATLAITATQFTTDGLAAATTFAESASGVIALLKSGVEGFTALVTFAAPTKANVQAFIEMLNATVATLALTSAQFNQEGLAAATTFANAASAIIGVLKSGAEGFTALIGFAGPTKIALQSFIEMVSATVATLAIIAQQFGQAGLDAAQSFADAAGAVLGTIKAGIEAFTKLAEFKGAAPGLVQAFAAGLSGLLAEFQNIALPAAINLGAAVIGGMAQGVLGGAPSFSMTVQNAVTNALNAAATWLPNAYAIGQWLIQGMTNGVIGATQSLVNAVVQAMYAALSAAQAALGIASPSKVFEQLVGAQIGAGMARGITGSAPLVATAVGGLAGAAVGGAAGGRQMSITIAPQITVNAAPGQDAQGLAAELMPILMGLLRREIEMVGA